MSKFRTHQEMNEIYRELHAQGKSDNLYLLKYENNGQLLIFVGTHHTSDVHDKQWGNIEKEWQKFLDHQNSKKQVFCEGGLRDVHGITKEQSIKRDGDPGFTCWLADQANIPFESPEPNDLDEYKYLSKKFPKEQIIYHYFGRQMHQWVRGDKFNEPDWRKYAGRFITRATKNYELDDNWNLQDVLEIYKNLSGKEFSIDDEDEFYRISNPSMNKVGSALSSYRDQHLFDAIKQKWQSGYDIFVVYGSGHAITLEPALEALIGQNKEKK